MVTVCVSVLTHSPRAGGLVIHPVTTLCVSGKLAATQEELDDQWHAPPFAIYTRYA